MKRTKTLMAFLLMLFLLSSCGDSQLSAGNNISDNTIANKTVNADNGKVKAPADGVQELPKAGDGEQKASAGNDNNTSPGSIKDSSEVLRERYDATVENYVSAINKRDVGLVEQYIDNHSLNKHEKGQAEAILNDYSAVFNNSKNIGYRFIGYAPSNDKDIVYELYDSQGKSLQIELTEVTGNKVRMAETCLNYSLNVHDSIKRYVDTLKSGNLEIASFFVPEGTNDAYPESFAQEILEKYNKAFDLRTVGYKLTDVKGSVYIYDIYGTKDGQVNRHQIEIGCSNGLCGVHDEWVPPIQEKQNDTDAETDIEKIARKLIDQNHEAFTEIFYLCTLPVEAPGGIVKGDGIYPVKSDRFKTYADLKNFVRSTYVKKEADYLLTNFNNNGPQYMNIAGRLFADKSKEGGIGYYKVWDKYGIKLMDIKSDSITVSISLKEDGPDTGPGVQKDINITARMIKENGKWLLEKMVY